MSEKLLIVEDDKDLQKTLKELLQDEGFLTEAASTGADALRKIEKAPPDLVLLDLGLPDIQGEDILRMLREDYPNMPVVILTAKSAPQDIAQGLFLGADDYLPKPFSVEELLARINVRLKKSLNNKESPLGIGDLILDMAKMTAKRGDREIELTKTEFELIKFLIENKGRVMSREMILNHVWSYSPDIESRVVDVYIGYLRRKIDKGYKNKLIRNKRGFGYLVDG